ncbi:MAG: class I SAM-dependent methyltransferase [Candidatus Thorarchaeota archaeon SMTZ1-45]|nr:MAG: hypothetical protein AM325_09915 [Candidatus Thorarchaeota archaeon SMTZ1-45]
MDEYEIDDKRSSIPFTARLIAHYRAMESRRESPLIVDPYAERLAGNMESYFDEHRWSRGTGDYAVVRTHYIDNYILTPWCEDHAVSQIVLLGAGLDARAYRLQTLKEGQHTIFEVDYDLINKYKSAVLRDEKPLCDIVRVSSDLSELSWISKLEKSGFSSKTPALWLLEGLVYYVDQTIVESILKDAAKNCADKSKVFADVCVPGLTQAQFGPFMMHFKWGLNIEDVPAFFSRTGWNVTCAFADAYDQGRDVGQKGLIFVTGKRDLSLLDTTGKLNAEDMLRRIPASEFQSFSIKFLKNVMDATGIIVEAYNDNPDDGLGSYFQFIDRIKPAVHAIIESLSDPLSIRHISSRLLRDPSTAVLHTADEKEAHIVGYLKALLFLGFCGARGIAGEHFTSTNVYLEGLKTIKIDHLSSLTQLIREEIDNS